MFGKPTSTRHAGYAPRVYWLTCPIPGFLVCLKRGHENHAILSPLREQRQADGRICRWPRIAELDGRALRVILLEDGETVHNALFDRDFKK